MSCNNPSRAIAEQAQDEAFRAQPFVNCTFDELTHIWEQVDRSVWQCVACGAQIEDAGDSY